ncbi:hypothetical protein NE686_17480 [Tissierella carlieri]|uniref:DUF4181 domain-containing protein n=1 Tax=Tissierella carlieri TaxID=689904 RepID=A0ABT1SEI3_9FIRM|nr:hypothetical protein [Tissierella carlieri]MCQ4924897.1 hypothetical protein [Tissierella carlieri]
MSLKNIILTLAAIISAILIYRDIKGKYRERFNYQKKEWLINKIDMSSNVVGYIFLNPAIVILNIFMYPIILFSLIFPTYSEMSSMSKRRYEFKYTILLMAFIYLTSYIIMIFWNTFSLIVH